MVRGGQALLCWTWRGLQYCLLPSQHPGRLMGSAWAGASLGVGVGPGYTHHGTRGQVFSLVVLVIGSARKMYTCHIGEVDTCRCCPWARERERCGSGSDFLRDSYMAPGCAKKSLILTPLSPVELFLHSSLSGFFLSFLL